MKTAEQIQRYGGWRTLSLFTFLLPLVAAILLTACNRQCHLTDPDKNDTVLVRDTLREVSTDQTGWPDSLRRAFAKWNQVNSGNYTFETTHSGCFCPRQWVTIRVENDSIVSIKDQMTGKFIGPESYQTISGIYAEIARFEQDAPDDYRGVYNLEEGYPSLVHFSLKAMAYDGGYGFEIRNLVMN